MTERGRPTRNRGRAEARARKRSTTGFMALEPRVMYDGATHAAVGAAVAHHHHHSSPSHSEASPPEPGPEQHGDRLALLESVRHAHH